MQASAPREHELSAAYHRITLNFGGGGTRPEHKTIAEGLDRRIVCDAAPQRLYLRLFSVGRRGVLSPGRPERLPQVPPGGVRLQGGAVAAPTGAEGDRGRGAAPGGRAVAGAAQAGGEPPMRGRAHQQATGALGGALL